MSKNPYNNQTEIVKYSSDNPNPIDKYVGSRIRLRRTALGYSQEKLADALGITFQQVQKYENATNRVGASRLWDISRVLGVETSFFYEGLMVDADKASCDIETVLETSELGLTQEVIESKTSLKLLRFFYGIKDDNLRDKIYDMVKTASSIELED